MPEVTETLCVSVYHAEIDKIHQELAELVDQLATAPDKEFAELYSNLVTHTEAHFGHEELLIKESAFPHHAEHLTEHRQMLQEMKQFQQRISRGRLPLARAYVEQRLPERFNLHITRMDSLLAAYLRRPNA